MKLQDHSRNVFSQFGEDGIIERIFRVIPEPSHTCVEFGAWDGIHLSNTRNLIANHGWSAVLIEGNAAKFPALVKNNAPYPQVTCLNRWVRLDPPDTIDEILATTSLPVDFDLLSIDTDGNDYHFWKSLERYRPRVVVIEFLYTVPNSIAYVQPADLSVFHGSSLRALTDLAHAKGYELIGTTLANAFFVRREFFPLFDIVDNSLDALHDNAESLIHVFQTFDGTLIWRGNLRLFWKEMDLRPADLQALPALFRFHQDAGVPLWRRLLFRLYRAFKRWV